jgi:hypothetical protein
LSEAAFQVFCQHKGKARAEFRANPPADGRDYHLGLRFLDDNTVLARIESAIASEAEFLADPYAWCLDALRDCASADHWYTFEKDYG